MAAVTKSQLIRQLTRAGYQFTKPPSSYSLGTLKRRASQASRGRKSQLRYTPGWERQERQRLTNELLRGGFRFSKPSNQYSLETLRRNAARIRRERPLPRQSLRKKGFTAEDWQDARFGNYASLYRNFLAPNRNKPWVGFVVAIVKGLASDTRPGVELGWVTVTPFATMRYLADKFPNVEAIHKRSKDWKGNPVGWAIRYRAKSK